MLNKAGETVVYISGPMSEIEDYNFPAFFRAEEFLQERGFVVENPARHFGGYTDLNREYYLCYDVKTIPHVDAVAVLPGWEESDGAKLEVLIAHELGKPIFKVYVPNCRIDIDKAEINFTEKLESEADGRRATSRGIRNPLR